VRESFRHKLAAVCAARVDGGKKKGKTGKAGETLLICRKCPERGEKARVLKFRKSLKERGRGRRAELEALGVLGGCDKPKEEEER